MSRLLPTLALLCLSPLLLPGCNSSFFAVQEGGDTQPDWGYYTLLQLTPAERRADKNIARSIKSLVKAMRPEDPLPIHPHVYNGIVLLLGNTPDFDSLVRVGTLTSELPRVKRVHNFLRIQKGLSFAQRLASSWMAIQSTFSLADLPNGIQQRTNVIAERDTVYIMGIIRPEEKKLLENSFGNQIGTRQLILLTEILD